MDATAVNCGGVDCECGWAGSMKETVEPSTALTVTSVLMDAELLNKLTRGLISGVRSTTWIYTSRINTTPRLMSHEVRCVEGMSCYHHLLANALKFSATSLNMRRTSYQPSSTMPAPLAFTSTLSPSPAPDFTSSRTLHPAREARDPRCAFPRSLSCQPMRRSLTSPLATKTSGSSTAPTTLAPASRTIRHPQQSQPSHRQRACVFLPAERDQ